ncbi:MAG: hypothetical protein AB7P17_15725, partial [Nitrospirales bacterium]
ASGRAHLHPAGRAGELAVKRQATGKQVSGPAGGDSRRPLLFCVKNKRQFDQSGKGMCTLSS